MFSLKRFGHVAFFALLALAFSTPANTLASDGEATGKTITIPRLSGKPTIENFLGMKPHNGSSPEMVKVEGFTQRQPKDGDPASQKTDAYLGYDDKNLYIVMVCFDSEPDKLRARMTRREGAFGDDFVEITLDTFHDRLHGFVFWSNPVGVQADGLWNENRAPGPDDGPDFSFDTVWDSEAQITEDGYVVYMAIPFKSLRFSPNDEQTWGITLLRHIPRANEWSYWPHVSSRVQGRLNQAGVVQGLANISPGRNIQLIPYAALRSFRALDTRDFNNPQFASKRAEFDGGLDAKFVLKDSLVLDLTFNPDFSQVESDEPQATVNQRFEVFFPEKRPFFLENSGFFQTPINLLFTRRIADPQFGARLTGKLGKYNIGALIADDESPGKAVANGDPLEDKRALFTVARVSRDILNQSSIGAIYTDREFENSFNRVGGIDARFKLNSQWVTSMQAVASSTRFLDGTKMNGTAYYANLDFTSRKVGYFASYQDFSKGYRTQTGFFQRPDIRETTNFFRYTFRPEGKRLISWGPNAIAIHSWDHDGTKLNESYIQELNFEFARQTFAQVFYATESEVLRPRDFPGLTRATNYHRTNQGFQINSSYFSEVSINTEWRFGQRLNFVPAAGELPEIENRTTGFFGLTVRPATRLKIDNTYIFERLARRDSGAGIFNNHIYRSKWNWQFNRALSLRLIFQYDTVLANPELTSLQTTKNFNADFLVTWLPHPGTALYIGYNSNLQNLDPALRVNDFGILRPRDRFINDGRQLFVKFSYLFRL
ncbi:MAG: DUF5916 domain-containing protein [Acidobacteriota bacterium]